MVRTAGNRTKIIFMVICIIICVMLVGTATFAWISTNRSLNNNGITMSVDTSPNLVISDSLSSINGYIIGDWEDSYAAINWADEANKLIPVDHYDSSKYSDVSGDNENTLLVYNTNPSVVDRTTGIKSDSSQNDLEFAHVPASGVPETGAGKYFIDYEVFIAALDQPLTQGADYTKLTFTITENSLEDTGKATQYNSAYRSASVDIWISGLYKGTLDLNENSTFDVTSIASIPENSESAISITFRCYFNGAMQKNSQGDTYVNSDALILETAWVNFNITIIAE